MTEEDRVKIQQIMQELAAQVLRQEQATPGVQDPELVQWATSKLSGNPAPPVAAPALAPVPTPPAAQPPLPPASMPTPPNTAEEEGVLHIQRPGQTIQPSSGQQDSGTGSNFTQDNGER